MHDVLRHACALLRARPSLLPSPAHKTTSTAPHQGMYQAARTFYLLFQLHTTEQVRYAVQAGRLALAGAPAHDGPRTINLSLHCPAPLGILYITCVL